MRVLGWTELVELRNMCYGICSNIAVFSPSLWCLLASPFLSFWLSYCILSKLAESEVKQSKWTAAAQIFSKGYV